MAGTIAECGFEASCELCSGTSWCKDIGIYIIYIDYVVTGFIDYIYFILYIL